MDIKRIVVSLLAAAVFVTTLPTYSFAASYSAQDYANASNAAYQAGQRLNAATTNLNSADARLNSAKKTEAEKKAAFTAASNSKTSMENELASSQELAAANNTVSEKREAVTQAEAAARQAADYPSQYSAEALAEAENAASAAKTNADQKKTALDTASAALTTAEATVTTKQTAYDNLLAQVEAEKQQDAALQQLEANVTSTEAAVKTAKTEATNAQTAYDQCGLNFLESKARDTWKYESIYNGCLATESLKEYAEDDQFTERVKDAYKPANIKKSIALMKECNTIRNNLGLSELKVSYDQMIASSFGMIYYRVGKQTGRPHIFVQDHPSAKGKLGENLAGIDDPFSGWYYDEKVDYAVLNKGITTVEGLMEEIETIEEEATQNGKDFKKWYAYEYATQFESDDERLEYAKYKLRDDTYKQVGHYRNIINTDYETTGFAYGRASEQSFSFSSYFPGAVTVAKFEEDFLAYEQTSLSALEAAKENVKTKEAEYATAVEARNSKLSEYDNREDVAQALSDLNTAIAAKDSAQADNDTAQTAYDTAASEKQTADAALKDQQDNAHYWQDAAAANEALETANNELTAAVNAKNDIENGIRAKYPEAANYDAAKAAYDSAVAARINAENAYASASSEYSKALSAKKAADAALSDQKANAYRWQTPPEDTSLGINVKIKKPARAKTAVTVKWKKAKKKVQKKINGYQVQISGSPDFSGAVTYTAGKKKSSKKIKKLARKTTYYVRVRAYQGSRYGLWSTVKAVKTK